MYLMRLLADLRLDAPNNMQIAFGTARLAEAVRVAAVTEIKHHAKRLHIIPVVLVTM